MKDDTIHFIGICGVAMGSLACMLREKGRHVTGSDENIYPPMSAILGNMKIPLFTGFKSAHVEKAGLVIIGNAASRGNPEIEETLNAGTPYMSMAQALQSFFLYDKEVISVSGTHGKSTTTALLARILESGGADPSFLIGATPKGSGVNYRLGKGRYFVIEGDEYDSAFFEKVPKFMIYRPRHLILTSLEFDHADIFRDLDEIKLWFRRLVNIIPSNGIITYSAEYDALRQVVSKSLSAPRSFGGKDADFKWNFSCSPDGFSKGMVSFMDGSEINLTSPLFGIYNYSNITAAVSMASLLGISRDAIMDGVAGFPGVMRRQDLIYRKKNIHIYEDFAHHPTAILATLSAMKERHPAGIVWAVYEPRSATSRRKIFQDILPASFSPADIILIKKPYRIESLAEDERIDIDAVAGRIRESGRVSLLFDETADMINYILANSNGDREHVIVIMSNGGFDGIYTKLIDGFERKFYDNNA